MLLIDLKLRLLFLNNVYQWYSSSCGSWIYAWILILYLVIWWHLWLKKQNKTKQQSEVQAYGTCCFSYTQRLFTFFFFSSSFFSPLSFSGPHTSFTFWLSFRCPSFSFFHLISDCLLVLCFVLSHPPVSSPSGSIHVLHHHQIGFSAWVSSVQMPPELLLSLLPLEQLQFTHWWWGFKPENLVSHGWTRHPWELVAHGGRVLRPILRL